MKTKILALSVFIMAILFIVVVSCKKDKEEEAVIDGGGTGEPCPGTPTVYYQGQTYNTVLIGNQCWMKENLNYATGNSWCYDNITSNCNTYGRLYLWATLMNGEASSNSVPSGVQGICPSGWHIPSDEEWKILEGTVDTEFEVGHEEWDIIGFRGIDAGQRLKTTTGWSSNTGTDIYGFSALPGGCRYSDGYFYHLGDVTYFWSSTEYDSSSDWYRYLGGYGYDEVGRSHNSEGGGFSARCVKD